MNRILVWLGMVAATSVAMGAPQKTNAPAASATNQPAVVTTNQAAATATNQVAASTNEFSINTTEEELEKMVLKPPTSKTPVPIMPFYNDRTPAPKLDADALRHQYLGFRVGMTPEEAMLLAQTQEKKLDELDKGKKYQMDGCLTEVPPKGKTVLSFKDGKLDLIMIYWDDNNTLFITLEQGLIKKYGKALPVDELFRRYWELANGDWIRLFYNVGAHQTSLVYASKKSLFDLNEKEKQETPIDFKGL